MVPESNRSVFVGRRRELKTLELALGDAIGGRGRLVLLAGDAGIGKSALTEKLIVLARDLDVDVLLGRCYDVEGASAYWPWVQAIRAYFRGRSAADVCTNLGSGASLIDNMIGEPPMGLSKPTLSPALEPAEARFHLFDAVSTFLASAASSRPIVLVIEDVHWADAPSLLLLQFLARGMGETRLLVVITYRDMEIQPGHPFADILGDLTRHEHSLHLDLDGLSESEVARLIELTTGNTPNDSSARYLHRATGGNPLFVTEIVRLLEDGGESVDAWTLGDRPVIPSGVGRTIGRRLKSLSAECRRLLEIAAVCGEDFGLSVLERVSDLSRDDSLRLLDEAIEARVVVELPSVLGRHRFAHALVREVLYAGLRASERMRLHRRVAQALEERCGEDIGPHVAELAHHYYLAASGGEAEKAIHYAILAAERSLARLGYEEAVGHYERALQALELEGASDRARRCDLLLALGDAQVRAGDVQGARQSGLLATQSARELGDARRLARAAIGTGDAWIELGTVDSMRTRAPSSSAWQRTTSRG